MHFASQPLPSTTNSSSSDTIPPATPHGSTDQLRTDESAQLLAVQCGSAAVLRLSFDQLLQLAGGAQVADVADAPAEAAAAVSTVTGTAAAVAPGQVTQGPVSTVSRMHGMALYLHIWLVFMHGLAQRSGLRLGLTHSQAAHVGSGNCACTVSFCNALLALVIPCV